MSVHHSHREFSTSAALLPVTTASSSGTTNSRNVAPQVYSRPVGEHARAAGFNWAKRTEQHRYRRELGLPEIHAAIINEDWDTALELVCAEDLGLQWFPPASHSSSPTWTTQLFRKNETELQSAIIEMAIDKVSVTSVATDVVAYGANLITLSLLIPCPKAFRDKVFQLAAAQNSPYLHLHDGSGRTPLWIAIDRNDSDAVKFLLEAGASPNHACPFASNGNNGLPLAWAATQANNEVFALCLEKVLSVTKISGYYSQESDFLQLQRWANHKDEADILWLAARLPQLKWILCSLPNMTGTSICHRTMLNDEQCIKFWRSESAKQNSATGFYKNLLIGTAPRLGPAIAHLMLMAIKFTAQGFIEALNRMEILLDHMRSYPVDHDRAKTIFHQSVNHFILNRRADHVVELISSLISRSAAPTYFPAFIHKLQKSDLNQYRTIVNALWPVLSDVQKLDIFGHSAAKEDGRTEFVLSKMDCSLDAKTLDKMIWTAAKNGNRMAFEFAC